MLMISFDELVVTKIWDPKVVHTKKDTWFQMENRPYYGVCFSVGGQITYTMHGKTYVSTPDNAILVPQGSSYYRVTDTEGLFPLINFTCTGLACEEIVVIPLEDPQDCIRRFKILQQMFLVNMKL